MSLTDSESQQLKETARKIRCLTIDSLYHAGSGHTGGALSIVDLLTVLYYKEMRIRPSEPSWPDRDRFVLSKGHACPSYYAVLADKGYFSVEELPTLRHPHSILQGHPCMVKTPGVDMSSGSLGQGLAAAAGMALYARKQHKSFLVYCICGDGECDEGEIWETAMSAAHYHLDQLIVMVDANRLQIDGWTSDVMNTGSLTEKFSAFGWNTAEIDGNNVDEIYDALEVARSAVGSGKPYMILCNTVKGKGVSFIENQVGWHGKVPNQEEYLQAMAELEIRGEGVNV